MNLFVNLTDLTSGSRNLYTMDKWFNYDLQTATAPAYLPGLAISVEKEGEFADVAFVNIVETYDGNSKIKQINRLDITNASGETKPDCDAAVEVALNNGRTDLIISNDVLDPINKKSAEDKTVSYVTDWDVRFDGELAMISRSNNHISKIALTNAKSLSIGDYTINLVDGCDYIELEFDGDITRVVSGNINDIIVEPKPVHFKDVKNSDWYYDAVAYVNTKGLFNGVSATEFGPNLSTTRAMLATVINRMAGNLEASGNAPFADVSNSDWFAPGVAWASEAKIVNGIGNQKFAPNSFITREQLCTMLLRYAEYAEITLPETVTITFNDTHQISNYAKNAVDAMSKAGVINGKNRGNFDPKGLATRAEVATMIYRFFQITSANNAK